MASKGKDSQPTDDVSVVLVVDIEYLKKKKIIIIIIDT